jgi:Fungal specific transcription factor domain
VAVMLKFIPTDATKLGQKRKQCSRACEACRRKKKRCSHLGIQGTSSASFVSQQASPDEDYDSRIDSTVCSTAEGVAAQNRISQDDVPHLGGALSHSSSADGRAIQLTEDVESHRPELNCRERTPEVPSQDLEPVLGSRFIGDLNPEGIFLAATSPSVTTGADQAERIGVWLTERLSKSQGDARPLPNQAETSLFYGFDPLVQKVMIPLLVEECLSLLPPQPELEKLCSIYFEKHHPIFPIIDEHAFRTMDPTDPASVLLKQGMCLVASLNLSAKGYLRVPKTSSLSSPREFGRRLSAAMKTSIELGLVTKKVVIIQALALLSLFIDGPNGGDLSSQFCARAVHYVHSVGLHIQPQRQGQDDQYAETLLCCIWALDRLNAALHGRPVLMHERDMGKDLDACFQTQNACFRLFLRIVVLLDKVIGLYRPSNDRNFGLQAEFPLFEELLEDVGGSQIPTPLLSKRGSPQLSFIYDMFSSLTHNPPATIETLYHAIAILSCRAKFPSEPHFSSTSYLRQNHSATQITSIVGDSSRKHLSWFPFVPYAVSLSLSVAYREMRHSRIPMYRARARSAMIRNCDILQDIEDVSWSASMMAEMGKATLKEMDRVYNEVATGRQRKNGQERDTSGIDTQDQLRAGTRTATLAPVPDHGKSIL